jgi:hypothetical protein
MGHFSRRRARLRPEYEHLYPRVVAGIWLGARRVVSTVRRADATARQRERDGGRLLLDAHFEFRGGKRREDERLSLETRSTDRRALAGTVPEASAPVHLGADR